MFRRTLRRHLDTHVTVPRTNRHQVLHRHVEMAARIDDFLEDPLALHYASMSLDYGAGWRQSR